MKQFVAFIVVFLQFASFGQNDFFDGIKAFNEEDYHLAAHHFRIETQENPNNVSGYYNLGLSLMEIDSLGKAIWAFEKVLKFNPNDSDAQIQLETCYAGLETPKIWEPRISKVNASIYSVSTNFWAGLSITFSLLIAIFIVVIIRSNNNSVKKMSQLIIAVFGAGLIFATVISYTSSAYHNSNNEGIVTSEFIHTYTKSMVETPTTLSEGERVTITNTINEDFVEVTTILGEQHVIQKSDIELI